MSWLVIINNGYSGSSVLSIKLLIVVCLEQLDEEIFIGLPVVIINDFDFNKLLSFSGESNDVVICVIVVACLCLSINRLASDST